MGGDDIGENIESYRFRRTRYKLSNQAIGRRMVTGGGGCGQCGEESVGLFGECTFDLQIWHERVTAEAVVAFKRL